MEQLIELFNEIPVKANGYNSQFRPSHKVVIQRLYQKVFGKKIPKNGNCKSCIVDAALELRIYFKNNQINFVEPKPVTMSKFVIGPKKVVNFQGFPYPLTAANCTDERAIAFLKTAKERGVNPAKLIGHFASYPANWQELVDAAMNEKPGKKEKEKTPAPVVDPPANNDGNGGNDGGDSSDAANSEAIEKTRQLLNAKNKKELKAMCKEYGLPEEEWQGLNKTELVEYLIKKV